MRKGCEREEEKEKNGEQLRSTNVVANQLHEQQPTAMLTACANLVHLTVIPRYSRSHEIFALLVLNYLLCNLCRA